VLLSIIIILLSITLLFVHTHACGNRIPLSASSFVCLFVCGVMCCVDCTELRYIDIRVRGEYF